MSLNVNQTAILNGMGEVLQTMTALRDRAIQHKEFELLVHADVSPVFMGALAADLTAKIAELQAMYNVYKEAQKVD